MGIFDANHVIEQSGLHNMGSTCYMNSLLQCLMSCTSLTKYFLKNKERYKKENNVVAVAYILILTGAKNSGLRLLFDALNKKYPGRLTGQQDSNEALHLFLEAIDDDKLYSLILHKHYTKLWCYKCRKQISTKEDKSVIYEIPTTNKQLDETINHTIEALVGYKCPMCSCKDSTLKVQQLAHMPDVLVVQFNKYFKKKTNTFPYSMEFKSIYQLNLKYELVGIINHMGAMSSGHYNADVFRKSWYHIDDDTIVDGSPNPTEHSYILFYHLSNISQI